mgnify:CR=1 FL=1
MKMDRLILFAVAGLACVAAAGALLGIPAAGLVLALVMVVCSAAVVQAYYHRREKYFHQHDEPTVTVRRKHMHGQDTLSGPTFPWP